MQPPITLEAADRDGAIAEAYDGYTRAQALRLAALGAVGVTGLKAIDPLPAGAASNVDVDLPILQFALVLERLGVAFYGEAVRRGKLHGETLRFARTVHRDEVDHVAFVEGAIRSLGSEPKAPPRFEFGGVTKHPHRFRTAAAALEELCVEALNGAGPLVSQPVLAGAGMLVSVEARHVSWIQNIRGANPVPSPFDTPATAAQAKRRAKATGFIKGKI